MHKRGREIDLCSVRYHAKYFTLWQNYFLLKKSVIVPLKNELHTVGKKILYFIFFPGNFFALLPQSDIPWILILISIFRVLKLIKFLPTQTHSFIDLVSLSHF